MRTWSNVNSARTLIRCTTSNGTINSADRGLKNVNNALQQFRFRVYFERNVGMAAHARDCVGIESVVGIFEEEEAYQPETFSRRKENRKTASNHPITIADEI